MRKSLVFLCTMLVVLGISTATRATLYDRGGGLIYDDVLDITWLQDTNYAKTSGYDFDGFMTWYDAMAWADSLVYGGYDDWRLPTTVHGLYVYGYDGTTTAGYNITSSEMGYMYYENLLNLGLFATDGTYPQPGWSWVPSNTGPFINLQPYDYYSGTEYPSLVGFVWFFGFGGVYQGLVRKGWSWGRAWAVRPGDSVPIPEPSPLLLLCPGLFGLALFSRKFRKS
jgi:hypothetical protein